MRYVLSNKLMKLGQEELQDVESGLGEHIRDGRHKCGGVYPQRDNLERFVGDVLAWVDAAARGEVRLEGIEGRKGLRDIARGFETSWAELTEWVRVSCLRHRPRGAGEETAGEYLEALFETMPHYRTDGLVLMPWKYKAQFREAREHWGAGVTTMVNSLVWACDGLRLALKGLSEGYGEERMDRQARTGLEDAIQSILASHEYLRWDGTGLGGRSQHLRSGITIAAEMEEAADGQALAAAAAVQASVDAARHAELLAAVHRILSTPTPTAPAAHSQEDAPSTRKTRAREAKAADAASPAAPNLRARKKRCKEGEAGTPSMHGHL